MVEGEIDKRVHKYFDLCKFFLKDVDSIDKLIVEASNTQTYLGELIQLKLEYGCNLSRVRRRYERETLKYKDIIQATLSKRGKKFTESIVNARLEYVYGEKLDPVRSKLDNLQNYYETINNLYFAMMQRKDIIVQIIDRWKFKDEYESCLLKNKQFIEKLSNL